MPQAASHTAASRGVLEFQRSQLRLTAGLRTTLRNATLGYPKFGQGEIMFHQGRQTTPKLNRNRPPPGRIERPADLSLCESGCLSSRYSASRGQRAR